MTIANMSFRESTTAGASKRIGDIRGHDFHFQEYLAQLYIWARYALLPWADGTVTSIAHRFNVNGDGYLGFVSLTDPPRQHPFMAIFS